MFDCQICKKSFENQWLCEVHVESVHGKENCRICFKPLSKKSLKEHIQSVHSDIKFKCDICQKEFSLERNLKKHRKAVHYEKFQVNCDICSKAFDSKVHLRDTL